MTTEQPEAGDSIEELVKRSRRSAFTDNLDEVVAALEQAMETASPTERGSLLLSLAIAEQGMSDTLIPGEHAAEAFELLRDSDRLGEAALAASVAAVMLHRSGRIRASIELAVEALIISETDKRSGDMVRALNSLAVVFAQLGSFETAYELSSRAFDGDTELAQLPAASYTAAYVTIDGLHLGCDLDIDLAVRAADRLAGRDTSNEVGRVVLSPGYFAEIAMWQRDLDALEAIDLDERYATGVAPRLRGWYLLVLGSSALMQGRPDEAVRHIDGALPLLASTSEHHRYLRALEVRREAWQQLGRADEALADAVAAIDRLEMLRQEHNRALGDQISERAKVEAARLALVRRAREMPEVEAVDRVSGVGSRKWLDVALEEIATAGGRATVVAFDLDHFDLVNRRFGHHAGDLVLRRMGRVLGDTFRDEDLVARYDGDCFVAVLPRASSVIGRSFANRVREALAAEPWGEVGEGVWIRASVGVATGRMDQIDAVCGYAFEALRSAKRAGRNRVVVV